MGNFAFSAAMPARAFAALAAAIVAVSKSTCATAVRWQARRQAVAHLKALNDAHLKDIGLHRTEIDSVVYYGREDVTRRAR